PVPAPLPPGRHRPVPVGRLGSAPAPAGGTRSHPPPPPSSTSVNVYGGHGPLTTPRTPASPATAVVARAFSASASSFRARSDMESATSLLGQVSCRTSPW